MSIFNKDSWEYAREKKLDALHDAYRGQRLFILGCGPSLNKETLIPRLSKEYTMGTNYLAWWHGLTFHPTFWHVCEWHQIRFVDDMLNARRINTQRSYSHFRPLAVPEDWLYIEASDQKNMQQGEFSGIGDVLEPLAGSAGSVVSLGVQFACWMGFNPIYLLGCDATVHGGHCYSDLEPVDRRRQDTFYRAILTANREMTKVGRSLIDLSQEGTLPLDRKRLKDVL